MPLAGDRPSLSTPKCGIDAINRPCQLQQLPKTGGLPFPRNPICRSEGETIFVVDDDEAFLSEVCELLSWIGVPVRGFKSAFEFQELVSPPIVGCVVADIRMPGFDGISLHHWLKSVNSIAPVVFLSGAATIPTAVECMKAGANDFLVKPVRETELTTAVTEAISRSRRRYCELASISIAQSLYESLTPAERTVADLIARGYVTKQVASLLGRSENTIKIHRHRILSKFGVSSTAALVRFLNMSKHTLMAA